MRAKISRMIAARKIPFIMVLLYSFILKCSVKLKTRGTIPIGLIKVNKDENVNRRKDISICYIFLGEEIPKIVSPFFNTILIDSMKTNLALESSMFLLMILFFE